MILGYNSKWNACSAKQCCIHFVVEPLSHVWLVATPWTVVRQSLLSMGFSRQEYWRILPFPPPGDFPNPGIKPTSPALAGGFFATAPPGNAYRYVTLYIYPPHTYTLRHKRIFNSTSLGSFYSCLFYWILGYSVSFVLLLLLNNTLGNSAQSPGVALVNCFQ